MVQVQSAIDTMEIINAIAVIYDRDPDHSVKVTGFALSIFDKLGPIHHYGPEERRLLEMASRLHDIGYTQAGQKPHNKTSRDLILNMDIPGISESDKVIFALIARYHTGELPDADEHRHFSELSDDRREVVEWLSGILRVADALDCKHLNIIKDIDINVADQEIILALDADGNCRKQIKRAREKEELLVKMTGKDIKYRC